MKLCISDDLVLGADFVTSTAGIFAMKGMGKSHVAQVLAEEMLEAGQVIVAVDPTDAWWGLRSSADGRRDGYPVVVVGGDHGDLKLELGGGGELAEAVIAERFSCVICTDGLSDAAETRFVREFLDALYRKNRDPIHVFVDESDIFAPQKVPDAEAARCARAMAHVVRRGRKKGIGTTLVTQRPAELSASVRTMVDMLFVLGMSHNLDIEAVEKWLRLRKKKRGSNVAFDLQEEMIASLDALQRGDAWVWAPRLGIHRRFRARQKRTFDSGATPRPGQKIRAPKKLAAVDLQRLGQAMAAAVQRQKENDPCELRRQLAIVRRDLARAEEEAKAQVAASTALRAKLAELEGKRVPKMGDKRSSVVKAVDLSRLEGMAKKFDQLIAGASSTLERQLGSFREEAARLGGAVRRWVGVEPVDAEGSPLRPPLASLRRADPGTPSSRAAGVNGEASSDQRLKPAHLRLLSAIAWWEGIGVEAPDLVGVAFVAGTSAKSSAFDNNRSRLRAAGYVDYPSSGRVKLTAAGRALSPVPQLPRTNAALQEAILRQCTPALGRMLRALIAAYPRELSLEDFAAAAETSTSSSAFDNNRSWLRARGLAEYPRTGYVRATAILFPEARD